MEVFYYRDPELNFGDNLNADLWPEILSPEMFAVDDVVVVGIGSILTEEWLGHLGDAGKRVIVLGSGTSYDLPPRSIAQWSVLAVRGPWTASLIEQPDAAVTDGAILLAAAPALLPDTATRVPGDVAFVPHHRSIRRTPWAEVAAEAGMRLVSPQQPVRDVLAQLATAELVVTEAMHGAIVADTLRIPWVPVTISPLVDEFKWRDWCASMGVTYEPTTVPTGDNRDRRRYARMSRVLRDQGLAGQHNLAGDRTRAELQDYFDRRFAPDVKSALLAAGHGSRAAKPATLVGTLRNGSLRKQAVAALRTAARREPSLSTDAHFRRRLEQMQAAADRAERLALGG